MDNNNSTNEKSIQGLEKDFNDSVAKIRKLISGKSDKNQLSTEEKQTLRSEYINAAKLAKKLAERHTEESEIDKYQDYYKKLVNKAESYGSAIKSKTSSITLNDVKGLNNVKQVIKTFIFMANNPEIISHYNMKGGLGLMMYGAPGTGKTMIAEAIANEMKMPLFIVTPADIFKSYVGESEQAVKQLFQEISTCDDGAILFVDECESIFSKRTADTKDYKAAVTTELLQRINGFGVDGSKRILIGATNRPDMIDPAYLRYKRFSHLIHVTPPDSEARRAIIENKLKGIDLDDVTVDDVLAMTNKYSGLKKVINGVEIADAYYSSADICGIVEEACRIALEKIIATDSKRHIPLTKQMFEDAFAKIPPSISRDLFKQYEAFRKSESKELLVDVATPEIKESIYKNVEVVFDIEDDIEDTNNVIAVIDNNKIKCTHIRDGQYVFNYDTDDRDRYSVKIIADGKTGNFTYRVIKGISSNMDF